MVAVASRPTSPSGLQHAASRRGGGVFVLLGPPGAGKGTQARTLAHDRGLIHLATGDLLRKLVASDAPLGQTLKGFMDAGELVPDGLVSQILLEAIEREDAAAGFIVDGFPRTIAQAEVFDAALEQRGGAAPRAVLIDVPDKTLVDRLTGRRICEQQGHEFHVTFLPPAQAGVCDHDGSALIRRPDDEPATIARRLSIYHDVTEPLIAYFEKQDRLVRVDGQGDPAAVQAELASAISQPDAAESRPDGR